MMTLKIYHSKISQEWCSINASLSCKLDKSRRVSHLGFQNQENISQNYKLISFLSCMRKLAEAIIMKHNEKLEISPEQFGFRREYLGLRIFHFGTLTQDSTVNKQ